MYRGERQILSSFFPLFFLLFLLCALCLYLIFGHCAIRSICLPSSVFLFFYPFFFFLFFPFFLFHLVIPFSLDLYSLFVFTFFFCVCEFVGRCVPVDCLIALCLCSCSCVCVCVCEFVCEFVCVCVCVKDIQHWQRE